MRGLKIRSWALGERILNIGFDDRIVSDDFIWGAGSAKSHLLLSIWSNI